MSTITYKAPYVPANNTINAKTVSHMPLPEDCLRLKKVTTNIGLAAKAILKMQLAFGTCLEFSIEGEGDYLARIEWHYHPPGGKARPHGDHKGVTIFQKLTDVTDHVVVVES